MEQSMQEMAEELGRMLGRAARVTQETRLGREAGPLAVALYAYQRLFEHGVAHSMVLRADTQMWPPGWKMTWTAANRQGAQLGSDWDVVCVRHADVRTLGELALHRMADSLALHEIDV